jgi:hypothetical protein
MDAQFSSEVFRVAGRPNRTGRSDCQLSAVSCQLLFAFVVNDTEIWYSRKT